MKVINSFAFLPLLVALSVQSFAAGRTKEITLDKRTKVGKVELQPGTYKVAWSGTGPNVEVNFSKDRQVVARAAAKLANVRSELDSAVQTRNVDSGSAIPNSTSRTRS